MKEVFKSVLAVISGFITVVVLSIATDFVLETIGVFPPHAEPEAYTWVMFMFALVYRSIFTVAGGYVAAALAPSKPIRHAIILGIVGIVAGTIGAISAWDKGSHWYPISLVVGALPCTWLGGKLKK